MKSVWKNKKTGKRAYSGSYQRHKGERVFVLTATLKNGKEHNVAFESFQLAKQAGWQKIK